MNKKNNLLKNISAVSIINKMISFVLLALAESITGNTGVFSNKYSRMYASGEYNDAPLVNNTNDNNNISTNSMFSNGFNSEYIFSSTRVEKPLDIIFCQNLCNNNPDCQGFLNYQLDEPVARNNISFITDKCNTLTNTGSELYVQGNLSSESYAKQIEYHNYSSSEIDVVILNIDPYEFDIFPYNVTVYIDINNNAMLDDNEPNETHVVYDYKIFKFENIQPGVYTLRQIIHNDTCNQLYPGLDGSFFFQRI